MLAQTQTKDKYRKKINLHCTPKNVKSELFFGMQIWKDPWSFRSNENCGLFLEQFSCFCSILFTQNQKLSLRRRNIAIFPQRIVLKTGKSIKSFRLQRLKSETWAGITKTCEAFEIWVNLSGTKRESVNRLQRLFMFNRATFFFEDTKTNYVDVEVLKSISIERVMWEILNLGLCKSEM